jgi:hypothetical protein
MGPGVACDEPLMGLPALQGTHINSDHLAGQTQPCASAICRFKPAATAGIPGFGQCENLYRRENSMLF